MNHSGLFGDLRSDSTTFNLLINFALANSVFVSANVLLNSLFNVSEINPKLGQSLS